jgi:hypothetical protein
VEFDGTLAELVFFDAVVLLFEVVAVDGSVVAAVGFAPDAEAVFTGFVAGKSENGVSALVTSFVVLAKLTLASKSA